MSVVSSVIRRDAVVNEGLRMIVEEHTDSTGVVHTVRSFAAVGVDANAVLAQHAAELAENLAIAEAEQVIQQ